MATIRYAIYCCIFVLSISVSYANCDEAVPGHYSDRYIDNRDGTVTDQMTGLMWAKCILGMNWDDSLKKCMGPIPADNKVEIRVKSLNWQQTLQAVQVANQNFYADYNDWRLPNIKEIASIMDVACLSNLHAMALDIDAFDVYSLSSDRTSATSNYWSSTPFREVHIDSETGALINQVWKINFSYSDFGAANHPITHLSHARLVRGISQ